MNQAFLALGMEVFEAEGATFVRDRSRPSIRDSNHVARVTASTPDEIDSLLARVEREYAGFPHRRFDLDFTTPPAFAARLAFEGYEEIDALVMLLEGELSGAPSPMTSGLSPTAPVGPATPSSLNSAGGSTGRG